MKIIKSPKADKLNEIVNSIKDKKITCRCGCEFEWDAIDIQEQRYTIGLLTNEEKHCLEFFVACPDCGKKHSIAENIVEWVVIRNESTGDKVSK